MKKLKRGIAKIKPADKYLVCLMIILLLQSAYAILFGIAATPQAKNIDVVVRTAISSIFGYFISANFWSYEEEEETPQPTVAKAQGELPAVHQSNAPKAQIGFTAEVKSGRSVVAGSQQLQQQSQHRPRNASTLQINIVGCICIFALVILLVARNVAGSHESDPLIVSQLRDLVAGGIGFLVATISRKKS